MTETRYAQLAENRAIRRAERAERAAALMVAETAHENRKTQKNQTLSRKAARSIKLTHRSIAG